MWAIDQLLDQIEDRAEAMYQCCRRSPQLIKLLARNLDLLSLLAGFNPYVATDTWNYVPTHTLCFAEVLSKVYASDFGIGDLLFLFTVDEHLEGDDPFSLGDENESLDSPLDLPDDQEVFSLWSLRRKLLCVHVSEHEAAEWTWPRIESSLRDEFGYHPQLGDSDRLQSLGEHFFPCVLERCYGSQMDLKKRQYRTSLTTTPQMWNTPSEGPFRYDSSVQELWIELPMKDDHKLLEYPPVDNLSSVTAIDLLGNGTTCLVWSSPLASNSSRPMRYIDLMGGIKPHLLICIKNNLAAETKLQYTPSTKFYLLDKH
jgi:hypothetical protein